MRGMVEYWVSKECPGSVRFSLVKGKQPEEGGAIHIIIHPSPSMMYLVGRILPQICTSSAKANMKHTVRQMQYRFSVINGPPCSWPYIMLGLVLVLLYVQELVTLQKKYLIYLHRKIRFTLFINYYDTLGRILFVYRAK